MMYYGGGDEEFDFDDDATEVESVSSGDSKDTVSTTKSFGSVVELEKKARFDVFSETFAADPVKMTKDVAAYKAPALIELSEWVKQQKPKGAQVADLDKVTTRIKFAQDQNQKRAAANLVGSIFKERKNQIKAFGDNYRDENTIDSAKLDGKSAVELRRLVEWAEKRTNTPEVLGDKGLKSALEGLKQRASDLAVTVAEKESKSFGTAVKAKMKLDKRAKKDNKLGASIAGVADSLSAQGGKLRRDLGIDLAGKKIGEAGSAVYHGSGAIKDAAVKGVRDGANYAGEKLIRGGEIVTDNVLEPMAHGAMVSARVATRGTVKAVAAGGIFAVGESFAFAVGITGAAARSLAALTASITLVPHVALVGLVGTVAEAVMAAREVCATIKDAPMRLGGDAARAFSQFYKGNSKESRLVTVLNSAIGDNDINLINPELKKDLAKNFPGVEMAATCKVGDLIEGRNNLLKAQLANVEAQSALKLKIIRAGSPEGFAQEVEELNMNRAALSKLSTAYNTVIQQAVSKSTGKHAVLDQDKKAVLHALKESNAFIAETAESKVTRHTKNIKLVGDEVKRSDTNTTIRNAIGYGDTKEGVGRLKAHAAEAGAMWGDVKQSVEQSAQNMKDVAVTAHAVGTSKAGTGQSEARAAGGSASAARANRKGYEALPSDPDMPVVEPKILEPKTIEQQFTAAKDNAKEAAVVAKAQAREAITRLMGISEVSGSDAPTTRVKGYMGRVDAKSKGRS